MTGSPKKTSYVGESDREVGPSAELDQGNRDKETTSTKIFNC